MIAPLPIRPTVRAVIRRDGKFLIQVKQRPDGRRYLTLPGGRQEPGETMQACLIRECEEEIGIAPTIGDVLHVADVTRIRPDAEDRQLIEILFACTVPDSYRPQMGARPDKRQVQVRWVDPETDGPAFVPRYDLALGRGDAPVYLGALRSETA
ncbi:NUDIX domain-containing protein [Rhodovulum adriaticum]|uniref:ADP-ribose pyrophosphatase YjhB (NUDIX family) n=1 Tax=Rhodovulum adriaticum TaxID=35804 RepID=A0A4R2NLS1_RHOAD|nr:NUDIX domain-containing protein [Rhodovulum adriaticum]MBK1635780.1 DNA mismatch repair protein MutT [Rhodovulum adriaticum]TCP22517.1 ADP-ribose pyrophosphatase YjhB (NUDIX family) [Rhodovulum adriaticum]